MESDKTLKGDSISPFLYKKAHNKKVMSPTEKKMKFITNINKLFIKSVLRES